MQLLGPLAVAIVTVTAPARRRLRSPRGLGVWLFHAPSGATLPAAGLALALLSAAAMGGYLVLSRKVGASVADGLILALAVTVAAVISLPFGASTELGRPSLLLAGFGVAVLARSRYSKAWRRQWRASPAQ